MAEREIETRWLVYKLFLYCCEKKIYKLNYYDSETKNKRSLIGSQGGFSYLSGISPLNNLFPLNRKDNDWHIFYNIHVN